MSWGNGRVPTTTTARAAAVPLEASVVITAWNRAAYLGEAVRSALAQTRAPREILVVDDGSTDDSAEIAESFGEPVRVLRRPHGGMAAALNTGVAAARGDVIAFLDSDDLWLPEKLGLQLGALESDSGLDGVYGWSDSFACPTLGAAERAQILVPAEPAQAPGTSCLAIRAALLERVGPFADFHACVLDWLNRAGELSARIHCIDAVLMRRRLHADCQSVKQRERVRRSYLDVAKAALDRRRRARRARFAKEGD